MKIKEDAAAGKVLIEGVSIDGFIDDRRCDCCDKPRVYCETFDAYFCPRRNEWKEETCGDRKCGYCRSRPRRPLPRS